MISLLIVNYRSAELTIEAIRSARVSTTRPLQIVVVDNSTDSAEAEALRPHADHLIVSASNRGYAGGINDGRRACEGEILIVANPDVVFAKGSIDALSAAFDDASVAAAGPAFFWDAGEKWMLPPADPHTLTQLVDAAIASRWTSWNRWRDRRRFKTRVRFWSDGSLRRVRTLSGAVMAIRARDFDDTGGFDERFALYFEETDFLRSLSERRRSIVYVPTARCRHLYNQSAGQDSGAASRAYAASERRFIEKWYGPMAAMLIKSLEQPVVKHVDSQLEGPIELPNLDVVVEASPLASFATAAGHFPMGLQVELPEDVWRAYRGTELFLRVADRRSGRVWQMAVKRRQSG